MGSPKSGGGLRVTFLCPHLRIAGGVRAILTHADRLVARGHEVSIVVPARRALRAWWRNRFPRAPAWMPTLRARVVWGRGWGAAGLPGGGGVVAAGRAA